MDEQGPAAGAEGRACRARHHCPPTPAPDLPDRCPAAKPLPGFTIPTGTQGRTPARWAAVALSCSSPAEPPAGSPCFLQQVAETAVRGYGDLDLLEHAHDRRCGLLDLVTANVARRIRDSSKRSATCPVPPLPR